MISARDASASENLSPRFNPSRITRINPETTEMTLAAVMNGKGNGNKDEVDLD